MLQHPTYTCYGAAQRVTGSKHLITSSLGTKILLDCGLVHGESNSMVSFEVKLNNIGFGDVEPAKMGVSHTLI